MLIVGLLVLILLAILWPKALRLVLALLFGLFLYALATVDDDESAPKQSPSVERRSQ